MTDKKLVRLVGDIHGKIYDYRSYALVTGVREACDGEDGPDTYSWETGIAP